VHHASTPASNWSCASSASNRGACLCRLTLVLMHHTRVCVSEHVEAFALGVGIGLGSTCSRWDRHIRVGIDTSTLDSTCSHWVGLVPQVLQTTSLVPRSSTRGRFEGVPFFVLCTHLIQPKYVDALFSFVYHGAAIRRVEKGDGEVLMKRNGGILCRYLS